jgi:hypothetical protein
MHHKIIALLAASITAILSACSAAPTPAVEVGDTWCDGDYDFGFRRLTCNDHLGSCSLLLQIFPREGVPATQRSYWRTCTTHDFTGFDSLVVTAPNGYESLDQNYYMALTECISQIEDNLH